MYATTLPLSPLQLREQAPAAFATEAHATRSTRYRFIPTAALIEGLATVGWQPVVARESRCRRLDRRGYSRHLLRFRQIEAPLPLVGDVFPELVLVNSHDGSCAYRLYAGLFRLVCSNGMVLPDAALGQAQRRHTGTAVEEVIASSQALAAELPRIAWRIDYFRRLALTAPDQLHYAEAARALRWPQQAPVTAQDLLTVQRPEDAGNDLWSIFQRVQENVIKGGLSGRSARGRVVRTRPIRAVTTDVALNLALWRLTEQVADQAA